LFSVVGELLDRLDRHANIVIRIISNERMTGNINEVVGENVLNLVVSGFSWTMECWPTSESDKHVGSPLAGSHPMAGTKAESEGGSIRGYCGKFSAEIR
jgi:hypothetical protein